LNTKTRTHSPVTTMASRHSQYKNTREQCEEIQELKNKILSIECQLTEHVKKNGPRPGEQFFFQVHALPLQKFHNQIAELRTKIYSIEQEPRRQAREREAREHTASQAREHTASDVSMAVFHHRRQGPASETMLQRTMIKRFHAMNTRIERTGENLKEIRDTNERVKNLREKRRADDKTEQIATREKQRAQYAKERPGKLEEQHKAFMEWRQERTLAQAASQAPAQVSLAAFETLMNIRRQIQEQRRLRNLRLRQSACQLDDVPMIFPVITE